METKTIFAFDKQGYFVEEVLFQIGPGIYLPDDATETPLPEANRQDNFFQWDGENGWLSRSRRRPPNWLA